MPKKTLFLFIIVSLLLFGCSNHIDFRETTHRSLLVAHEVYTIGIESSHRAYDEGVITGNLLSKVEAYGGAFFTAYEKAENALKELEKSPLEGDEDTVSMLVEVSSHLLYEFLVVLSDLEIKLGY